MPIQEKFNMQAVMREKSFCSSGTCEVLRAYSLMAASSDYNFDFEVDTREFFRKFDRLGSQGYQAYIRALAEHLGFESLEAAVAWSRLDPIPAEPASTPEPIAAAQLKTLRIERFSPTELRREHGFCVDGTEEVFLRLGLRTDRRVDTYDFFSRIIKKDPNRPYRSAIVNRYDSQLDRIARWVGLDNLEDAFVQARIYLDQQEQAQTLPASAQRTSAPLRSLTASEIAASAAE